MTRPLTALLALVASAAFSMGPLEKNHPLVEAGTQAFDRGDFAQALEKYDAAAAERPQDARIQYNRGLALHKLGRQEEAQAALQRANELDRDGALKGRIHYTLGNIAYAQDKKPEAVTEYRKALVKDPSDEQARHNLEVVLKALPPKSPPSPDGGTDGGEPDGGAQPDAGGRDGGLDGGRLDGGQPDGGWGDGGTGAPGDGGQGDGGAGDGGGGQGERRGDGGHESDENAHAGADGGSSRGDGGADESVSRRPADGGIDVSKQDAERLLDSLKSAEKNMQLWRFRPKTTKSDPHAKDW